MTTDAGGYSFCTRFFSLNSSTSPVVKGKVKLRTNVGSISKGKASGFSFSGARSSLYSASSSVLYEPINSSVWTLVNSKCAERLRSELASKGNLAVTLAQIHKSRENLITHGHGIAALAMNDLERLEQLYPGFDPSRPPLQSRARGTRRARRRTSRAERLANTASSKYLEAVFGWLPLIDEFNVQAENIKSVPPYRSTVRSSGKELLTRSTYSSYYATSSDIEQVVKCSYRATITVENPMTNLQSRSGITNLAGAAWDIVPWSFVINMFTNMGHVLNQLTPINGIVITDGCRTQRVTSIVKHEFWTSDGKRARSNASGYRKTIDAVVPSVSFRFRTPQMNAGLAAIAISLVTQKLTRISRIIL